jgi:4a-hydroxytetrahydrobiopterin dehydratase
MGEAGHCSRIPGACMTRVRDDGSMQELTNQQIAEARLTDWRKLAQRLHARFGIDDYASGVAFLADVGDVARPAGHFPEARLTQEWVEFALGTHGGGWWVTADDLDLARQISEIAARQGIRSDPTAVVQIELALDTANGAALGKFWSAVLTGSTTNVVSGDVLDPDTRTPNVWFQGTDEHDTPRQRFHLDVWLPPDVAASRIDAALGAGGRVVDDKEAPAFVVLADPDGNKACVCTVEGR